MADIRRDEELLAQLAEALKEAGGVPRDFIEAGKTAFAWHSVDADLAELTYDSDLDREEAGASTRADSASLRALTFVSSELTIELEVGENALLGQLVPPQAGEIHLYGRSGHLSQASVDEVGGFSISSKPAEPFRLLCRTETGLSVSTDWITL